MIQKNNAISRIVTTNSIAALGRIVISGKATVFSYKLLVLCAIALMAQICHAQQTSIQATVLDPSGFAYQFLTGTTSINCPGNQAPLYNGFTVPRNYPITGGDGNGHFTQVLYDVNAIMPSGCSYNFAITAQNGITTFIAPSIGGSGSATPITGAGPVNLSTAINAFAVLLPTSGGGGGTITGSISTTQVAVGSGSNAIVGDPNFTWLTANKKLLAGDPISGLSASTPLPPGNWALQGIHQNTSTAPQDTAVLGVIEADNGVDSSTNRINGGYFSASSLTTLYSGSGGGILNGLQGIGTALHATGFAGQILGGLFTANANGAGTTGDLAGVASQVHISGSGLVSSASAIHTYAVVVTGGTPPTAAYGLLMNPVTGGVNNWQIFMNNQIQDANHWAIQTGTGKVEFGDNVLVHGTIGGVENNSAAGLAGSDLFWANSVVHRWEMINNNGTPSIVAGFADFTSPPTAGLLGGIVVCSGQIALTTGAINSGTRATNTLSCPGLSATTDSISCTFGGDTNAVTGYAPSASGGITLKTWASTGTINVDQVNDTSGSITPGAATVNCKGIR